MLSCTAACPKHKQFIACTKIGIGIDLTARQNLKATNSAQNRRSGRRRLRDSRCGPNFAANFLKSLPGVLRNESFIGIGDHGVGIGRRWCRRRQPVRLFRFRSRFGCAEKPQPQAVRHEHFDKGAAQHAASLQMGALDANRWKRLTSSGERAARPSVMFCPV